jgi:hypothetical protein
MREAAPIPAEIASIYFFFERRGLFIPSSVLCPEEFIYGILLWEGKAIARTQGCRT